MTSFESSFVESWKENGFGYILILPKEKYGVLRPLANERETVKGFTIAIDELRLIHMEVDYFIVKEKDAVNVNAHRLAHAS